MKKNVRIVLFKLLFTLPLMLMIYISPASAQYSYELVIPSGWENAGLFGINATGKIVGRAWDNKGNFESFEYDMGKRLYMPIRDEDNPNLNVFGINNLGVMVGDVDGVCVIRDKDGNIRRFYPPGYADYPFCQARGVNRLGKVSGFEIDDNGTPNDLSDDTWQGFIYDSNYDTFEEFWASPQTFPQGINTRGQNVGSVFLDSVEAYYPHFTPGRYGYLRQTDGSVKHFEISQSLPGESRARGLSESGLVSGFFKNSGTQEFTGYVTTLSQGNEFETITLTHDQVVHLRPCNPDLEPPSVGYVLLTDVFTSQVRNDGVVVGQCTDYHYNSTTGDLIQYPTYGLIATPIQTNMKGGGNKCLSPPTGMTNWWPGDGNSFDVVGGLDGEFVDDAATGPGLVDEAFTLDGNGDFINVTNDSALDFGTDDFTVDLWVNFNNTSGEQVLVEKWVQNNYTGGPTRDGWTLTKLDNNHLRIAFSKGGGEEADLDSNELTILPGNWYHFAATREGDTFTLYMNGWVIARDAFVGELNLNSASSLKFGHRGNLNDTPNSDDERGFYLNGRIDEVELFVGTALSEEQIQALYAAGSRGKCKDDDD